MNDNIYLAMFLDHHYPKNPVYISNSEIEGFIRNNEMALTRNDFLAIGSKLIWGFWGKKCY